MSDKRDDNIIRESFHAGYQAGYENGKRDAVRHGYWTCVNTDENVYMCDGDGGCGCTIQLIEGTPKENMFDYCPECGARLIDEMEYKMLYHSAFPDGKEGEEGA